MKPKLKIVKDGVSLTGKICYFLDAVEGGEEPVVNKFGKELEPGEHFVGFFNSEPEAIEWARLNDYEIEGD